MAWAKYALFKYLDALGKFGAGSQGGQNRLQWGLIGDNGP